jgi:hypothetical protein
MRACMQTPLRVACFEAGLGDVSAVLVDCCLEDVGGEEDVGTDI